MRIVGGATVAAVAAMAVAAHGAAMLEVNGLVTEKVAGWRFEASDAKGGAAFHSQFHALVKRAYPKSDVTWLVSVRGSTGCWYYCEPENFRKYVADYKPDCVFIGGISGWIHPEMPLNGGPAIESVARRVNEELGAEVVVMTPTLAIDLRVPEGTERGTAVAPSKFDHAALGDRAWKYDVAAAEELKAVCAKNGWPLWDMFTPAYDWLFKTGLPSEFYSRDYIHSGELGKQIIGRIAIGYFMKSAWGQDPLKQRFHWRVAE